MARKSNKRKSRKKSTGVSVLDITQTYLMAQVVTDTLFNVNLYDFFMADGTTVGSGNNEMTSWGRGDQITLREILNFKKGQHVGYGSAPGAGGRMQTTLTTGGTMKIIKDNFDNNWVSGLTSTIVIPAAFKVGKTMGRQTISRVNKLLKKSGIGQSIKV